MATVKNITQITKEVNSLYEEELQPSDVQMFESHMELFNYSYLEKANKEELVNIVKYLVQDNRNADIAIEDYLLEQANIFYVDNHWLLANPTKIVNRNNAITILN